MDYSSFSPCVRYANTISLNQDYPHPLLAYDHRLLYVREGRMTVEVSGEKHTLSPGDLLIFPPATPYRITFGSPEDRRYVLVNFDFDSAAWGQHPSRPMEERNFDPAAVFSSEEMPPFGGVCHLHGMKNCAGILEELCRVMREDEPYSFAAGAGLLKAVLVLCAVRLEHPVTEKKEEADEDGDRLAERIRAYVDKTDITEPITNASVARELHYHPYYIARVFSRRYGFSLHHYIVHRRVAEARRLLSSTYLSAGEIAARCGFCGESYFAETFRRFTGMSPTEFRGKNR